MNSNLKDIWDKAAKEIKEPKSNKQLVVEGVIGAAVVIALGGAVMPTLAGAAVEGIVTKKWSERKKRPGPKNGQPPRQPDHK